MPRSLAMRRPFSRVSFDEAFTDGSHFARSETCPSSAIDLQSAESCFFIISIAFCSHCVPRRVQRSSYLPYSQKYSALRRTASGSSFARSFTASRKNLLSPRPPRTSRAKKMIFIVRTGSSAYARRTAVQISSEEAFLIAPARKNRSRHSELLVEYVLAPLNVFLIVDSFFNNSNITILLF